MKEIGEIIREEMIREKITQTELAKKLNINRSLLSRYINGHRKIPEDILRDIAKILNSPVLKILLNGTISSKMYLDKVKTDFYTTGAKTLEEMEETSNKLKQVMSFAYNAETVRDLTDEQKKTFELMTDKIHDTIHCLNTLDITACRMGLDPNKRNIRCINKYYRKGYISDRMKRIIFKEAG